MDVNDIFGPNPTVIDLAAADRWDAIDEMIDHLVAKQKLAADHRAAVVANVRKRESAMSTGIGFGIGLPHACTDFVAEVTGLVGRSRNGIHFDALDGKPVNLVFLFLVPSRPFQKHLETLRQIAKLMHQPGFRDKLWGRFGSSE